MNKKKILWILLAIFLINIISINSSAAIQDNLPDTISDVVATLDFGKWIDTPDKQLFLDAILYFIFFIGIVQAVLSKRFEGRGGKTAIVAIGIALAGSMVYYESTSDFRLVSLWPIAMLMIVVFVVTMFWRFVKGDHKTGPAIWWAIILTYIVIMASFPQAIDWLRDQGWWGQIIIAGFTILLILAIPLGFTSLVRGGGRGHTPTTDWSGGVVGDTSPSGGADTEDAAQRIVQQDSNEGQQVDNQDTALENAQDNSTNQERQQAAVAEQAADATTPTPEAQLEDPAQREYATRRADAAVDAIAETQEQVERIFDQEARLDATEDARHEARVERIHKLKEERLRRLRTSLRGETDPQAKALLQKGIAELTHQLYGEKARKKVEEAYEKERRQLEEAVRDTNEQVAEETQEVRKARPKRSTLDPESAERIKKITRLLERRARLEVRLKKSRDKGFRQKAEDLVWQNHEAIPKLRRLNEQIAELIKSEYK